MHKITLLFFALLATITAHAQSASDSSIIQKSEYIIQHLDKANIPTGVLYDMVVPFGQLHLHNGQNDSAISSPLHFQQAYFEFYQSAFNKQSLATPENIINLIQNEYQRATHPLGMIFASYASIKPNAITDSLLFISNGQLYEVPGAATPYNIHEVFIANPLTIGEHLDVGTHTFILDEIFILGNNYKPIKKITLTLLNSNLAPQVRDVSALTKSQFNTVAPFEFDFDTTGLYTLGIEVEFMDNSTVHTKACFDVVEGSEFGTNHENKRNATLCDTCIVIQGIDGGDSLIVTGNPYNLSDYGALQNLNNSTSGIAYIFYATNNNGANYVQKKIKKPIIFLDGFDPTNSRDVPRIYTRYINKKFEIQPGMPVIPNPNKI